MSYENNKNIFIALLTILTLVLSVASFAVTYIKVNQLKENLITGFSTSGYVNLTIYTSISLNVSNNSVNWGEGTINTTGGWTNATLSTNGYGGSESDGNVSCGSPGTLLSQCGNWSGVLAHPLLIENIGSVNASLAISSDKTNKSLFGGSDGNQAFKFQVTDRDPNSCTAGGDYNNTYVEFNSSQIVVCRNLGFLDQRDTMWINIRLMVPYDANVTQSPLEARSAIITITATAAA